MPKFKAGADQTEDSQLEQKRQLKGIQQTDGADDALKPKFKGFTPRRLTEDGHDLMKNYFVGTVAFERAFGCGCLPYPVEGQFRWEKLHREATLRT